MKFFKSTVYQIYIKSFNDSNGDGIGDINGITEKLDYLKDLGVDYLWITPFFKSPQKDNGYDISNYLEIDPIFGTMEDFDNLIKESNKRKIGIMLDMVFNHTSTEHIWFKKALQGDEKYINYYIFKDEKTNWESKFGGNAWQYVKELDKYYLHLFDVTQADLNWDNKELREELKNVVRFWKKKGVSGFRFDVVNLISKPNKFVDDNIGDGRRFYTDGPNIHQYLKELVKDTNLEDMITVGEMSSTSLENCIKYSNPNEKELSQVFNFHHLKVDYKNKDKWELMEANLDELYDIFSLWQEEMYKNGGWNALFWCNHDQPRIVSRFGQDKEYRIISSKMLATFIHLLRGTPYIYQGEEIGMTNAYYKDISEYLDVESINYYNILLKKGKSKEEALNILSQRSRDNSRTPVQWNNTLNAGFSTGKPWMNLSNNYKEINVEKDIKDEQSILNYYKKLVSLRKKEDIISQGDIKFIKQDNNKIFIYKRTLNNEKLYCICNFSKEDIDLDMSKFKDYEVLIQNYSDVDYNKIRAYEAIVYIKR